MRKTIAALLIALGFLMAALTLGVVRWAMTAEPILLEAPAGAGKAAVELMDAICRGDNAAVSSLLYGNPSLGTMPEDTSPQARELWEAYRSSLSYEFKESCYAGDAGIRIDVSVSALDIPALLPALDSLMQQQLDRKLQSQKDLLREDGTMKPETAETVFSDALLLALGREKPLREQTVTLSLILDQGEWQVMPEGELLSLLSGSISG